MIEQGLKKMEIAAINQRDLYRGIFQRTSSVQSAKPATDNHDVRHSFSAYRGQPAHLLPVWLTIKKGEKKLGTV